MRVFLLFFLMQPVLLQVSDRDKVMGLWASDASIFEIIEAEGVFLGVIQVLKDPTYTNLRSVFWRPQMPLGTRSRVLPRYPLGLKMEPWLRFAHGQVSGIPYRCARCANRRRPPTVSAGFVVERPSYYICRQLEGIFWGISGYQEEAL